MFVWKSTSGFPRTVLVVRCYLRKRRIETQAAIERRDGTRKKILVEGDELDRVLSVCRIFDANERFDFPVNAGIAAVIRASLFGARPL